MATPSLLLIPDRYKSGVLYSQLPESGAGDIDFTRGSTATRVNALGLIESVASGVPRLDYTGGGCPSLLLEPQRTNLITFSEEFDNAAWVKGNATISANTSATLDPSGYNGSDKLQEDSSTDSHYFGSDTVSASSGDVVTFSIFLKAAERSFAALRLYTGVGSVFGYYNLANGTLGTIGAGGTGTIVSYGNGWYRCSLTITMALSSVTLPYVFTSTGDGVNSYTGVTGNGIYCFGAQQEIGSYPTSYIPTTTAAVTRLADAASKTGISSLIGQTEGTLFLELDIVAGTPVFHTLLQVYGDANNRISIGQSLNSTNVFIFINANGVNTFLVTTTPAGKYKLALAYESGNSVLYVNGLPAITTAFAFTFTTALSQIFLNNLLGDEIGIYKNSASALYPTRLSNAELQSLTSL
jgi:hypothetical protein